MGDVIYQFLEHLWSIAESKEHDNVFKVTIRGVHCGFSLILNCELDCRPTPQIHPREHSGSLDPVK